MTAHVRMASNPFELCPPPAEGRCLLLQERVEDGEVDVVRARSEGPG